MCFYKCNLIIVTLTYLYVSQDIQHIYMCGEAKREKISLHDCWQCKQMPYTYQFFSHTYQPSISTMKSIVQHHASKFIDLPIFIT